MKKIMIFAATAAVVLASCAKSETYQNVREENAITFNAYSGNAATKAGVIDLAALQTQGFGVFTYYTDNGGYNASTSPINFMYNTKVSTSGWTYSPIKYWPNEATDKLSFFAYAPWVDETALPTVGITTVPSNTDTGDPVVTYTVAQNPAESVDFLWSDADNKDKTKQAVTGTVNFTFKHQLARLGFEVRGVFDKTTAPSDDDVNAATKIYVNSLDITTTAKIPTSGEFNLNTGAWSNKSGEATLAIATANIPSAINGDPGTGAGVTKTATSLLNDGEYFMFIPDATAQTYNFKINYSVITTDSRLNGGKSTVVNEITNTASIKFEAGKAYKIILELGMTTVKMSAEVANWTNADDQSIWLPINN